MEATKKKQGTKGEREKNGKMTETAKQVERVEGSGPQREKGIKMLKRIMIPCRREWMDGGD